MQPPLAARKPKAITRHGDRRVDPYLWLREKSNPAVIAYLDAENRYTKAAMKPLAGFRESLYKEMLARIKETDESVPYRRHGYWYYVREVEGLQYPIYCRRKGAVDAPEVVLDVNALAHGHAYCAVGLMEVSPDAARLAYTVDFAYRQYTMHVKDLATGSLARETAVRVTSTAWAADNRTLFYVQEHETTKRRLPAPPRAPGRSHARARLPGRRRALRHQRVRHAKRKASRARHRQQGHDGHPDPARGRARRRVPLHRPAAPEATSTTSTIAVTSSSFAPTTRDAISPGAAPEADPARKNWKQVVAHRPRVMLEECDVFDKVLGAGRARRAFCVFGSPISPPASTTTSRSTRRCIRPTRA